MELADYVATSNSLLQLELMFDFFRDTKVLESFLSRVFSSKIVSFSIRVETPISVSAESPFHLVRLAKFMFHMSLDGIVCPELHQDPSQLATLQQLVDSHPSLELLRVGSKDVYNAGHDRPKRYLYVEKIVYLIRFTRLLAGHKQHKPLRVPQELILQIFKLSTLETRLVNSPRLNLILNCISDRRTLGRVQSEVIPVDWAILYAKCSQALMELE
jgi:hypothetical protein